MVFLCVLIVGACYINAVWNVYVKIKYKAAIVVDKQLIKFDYY